MLNTSASRHYPCPTRIQMVYLGFARALKKLKATIIKETTVESGWMTAVVFRSFRLRETIMAAIKPRLTGIARR